MTSGLRSLKETLKKGSRIRRIRLPNKVCYLIAGKAYFNLGRIPLEDFEISPGFRHERYGHWDMPHADADILLRIGIEIDHHRAAGLSDDRSAKAADISLLEDGVFQFHCEHILEFIDADAGEVLIERVNAASPTRLAIGRQKEGSLIDAVRIASLGKILVQVGAGVPAMPTNVGMISTWSKMPSEVRGSIMPFQ